MKFFVILFLLLSLPGLCQEGATGTEELPDRVQIIETPPAEPAPTAPVIPQDEDEKLINNLREERSKQMAAAVQVDQTRQQFADQIEKFPDELKKLGYESLNSASLLDKRVLILVKDILNNSPLQHMSEDQVKNLILSKYQGKDISTYLLNHPKILNLLVDLVRDQRVLPGIIQILLKREVLKMYFFIWLGIVLTAWALKKYYVKKQKWARGKIFMICMAINLCASLVSLSLFYNMFKSELSPTTEILVKHWRRRNL